MRQRILQMAPTPHRIRTQQDPMARTEPPRLPRHRPVRRYLSRTPSAHNVGCVEPAAEGFDFFAQEAHGRRPGEEVVPVFLAARAVAGFVDREAVFAEVLDPLARDGAREDAEVVEPPGGGGVVVSAGGVVGEEVGEALLGGGVGGGGLWWWLGGLGGCGRRHVGGGGKPWVGEVRGF